MKNLLDILVKHLQSLLLLSILVISLTGCNSPIRDNQEKKGEIYTTTLAEYKNGEDRLIVSIYPKGPWIAGVPLKLRIETLSEEKSSISIPDLSQDFSPKDPTEFKITRNGDINEITPLFMRIQKKKKSLQIFTLYTTLPNTYILPGFSVEINEVPVFTEEIPIVIESALTENQEMYDVSEPLKGKGLYNWQIILFIVIGIVIMLAIFFSEEIIVFFKKLFSPRFNALKSAKKDITKLTNSDLNDNKKRKEFYFALSGILRSYMDAVLPYEWSSKTTEELLPELEKTDSIYPGMADEIRDFFLRGEGIKFAGDNVSIDQAKKDLTFCSEWIELEKIHLKHQNRSASGKQPPEKINEKQSRQQTLPKEDHSL